MTIEWMAHACFKVTLEDGRILIFDPFHDSIGYTPMDTKADIVMISHDHRDHSCLDHIRGDYKVIREPGEFDINGVHITGIKTFHDKTDGTDKGENITYKVTAEGITLLHLGDLGHIPDEEYYEKTAGEIDVLFIPVGGRVTLNGEEAFEVAKRIDPNIIVPMHYKTMLLELHLDTVYGFTDAAKGYYDRSNSGTSTFSIAANRLKKRPRIMVLQSSLEE